MDFFADGGFQQLFCDLNEQQTFVIYDKPWSSTYNTCTRGYDSSYCLTQVINQNLEENYLSIDQDYHTPLLSKGSASLSVLQEQQLQNSLDYLLTSTADSLEDYDRLSPLHMLAPDLAEWEEKFLDNFVEIPELVDILPEKTPLCTDTCNHFLEESAKNLKISSSRPTSPTSPKSCKSSLDNVKDHDKTYPCEFGECRKIYAKPAHLKAHLRRHLGEKPYICNWPECSWRFSRSDELSRHRRSHSGVKPYKCDFCAKCFARSDHLTKHRKVHERRLQAARKAGQAINGVMPQSVLTVRPGRKRKNQF